MCIFNMIWTWYELPEDTFFSFTVHLSCLDYIAVAQLFLVSSNLKMLKASTQKEEFSLLLMHFSSWCYNLKHFPREDNKSSGVIPLIEDGNKGDDADGHWNGNGAST